MPRLKGDGGGRGSVGVCPGDLRLGPPFHSNPLWGKGGGVCPGASPDPPTPSLLEGQRHGTTAQRPSASSAIPMGWGGGGADAVLLKGRSAQQRSPGSVCVSGGAPSAAEGHGGG